jgi:glycosyltransferase involved in cell wall biosynthesis
MINILYICTPSSIHDFKWMSFFSLQNNKYKVYAIYEKQSMCKTEDISVFKEYNIELLKPINTFSLKNVLGTIKSIFLLKKVIRDNKIDIVHVFVPTPYSLWLNFIRIPSVITTRGTDVLISLPKLKEKAGLKNLLLWILFKKSFRRASVVSCTSQAQYEKISSLFKCKNIQLVRTGVDVKTISSEKIRAINEIDNKKIIFSPRYINNPLYNINLQIESLEFISEYIKKDFVFVFIRKTGRMDANRIELENKLQNYSSKFKFNFIVLDHMEQEELWQYYKGACLVIMTPLSDGTPNSAMEAMAAKCPLIMPNLKYDEQLFKGSCFVLEENNPEKLAQLIEKALVEYPSDFVESSFQKVSKYGNRDVEMKKLEDIYSSILKM